MEKTIAAFGFEPNHLNDIECAANAADARLLPDGAAVADVVVIDASTGWPAANPPAGGRGMVLRVSMANLDELVDRWPDADIVIGQDPVDLHLAIASALKRSNGTTAPLFELTSNEGLRLQRLADEIARIARALVDIPEEPISRNARGGLVDEARPAPVADSSQTPVSAHEVRSIIRMRRLRDRYFPADMFADPAWDMLLDLAAARIERVRVAVSSLCIAAAVPPTTALRWIKAMTDRGLLRRVADPHDARRIFIQLSDDAAAAMEAYLRAARGSAGMAI